MVWRWKYGAQSWEISRDTCMAMNPTARDNMYETFGVIPLLVYKYEATIYGYDSPGHHEMIFSFTVGDKEYQVKTMKVI